MSKSFSITVREWIASEASDPIEQATSAELEIVAEETCLTQVEDFDAKTVRTTIRTSAEPLAKWLLANWWRLRWEAESVLASPTISWRMSHLIAAVGQGYIWPDLCFLGSDGHTIALECKRHVAPDWYESSPVRFLNNLSTSIPASDFEDTVKDFVRSVLLRLESMNIRKSELHDLYGDLSNEWRTPKSSAFRKIEALLALDPDEDHELVATIVRSCKEFGAQAVEEIAAASGGNGITKTLERTKAFAKSVRTFADIPKLQNINPGDSDIQPAWSSARSLAYAARKDWGLEDRPLTDDFMAERFSVTKAKLADTKTESPISFGLRGTAPGKLGLVLNRPRDHERRFDLSRLVGDYLAFDSEERYLPVTGSQTYRQKFQRAFAAELLCPSRMIKTRFEKGLNVRGLDKELDDVSREYNVDERIVLHHMVNRGVLSKNIADSQLAFA